MEKTHIITSDADRIVRLIEGDNERKDHWASIELLTRRNKVEAQDEQVFAVRRIALSPDEWKKVAVLVRT